MEGQSEFDDDATPEGERSYVLSSLLMCDPTYCDQLEKARYVMKLLVEGSVVEGYIGDIKIDHIITSLEMPAETIEYRDKQIADLLPHCFISKGMIYDPTGMCTPKPSYNMEQVPRHVFSLWPVNFLSHTLQTMTVLDNPTSIEKVHFIRTVIELATTVSMWDAVKGELPFDMLVRIKPYIKEGCDDIWTVAASIILTSMYVSVRHDSRDKEFGEYFREMDSGTCPKFIVESL